MLTTQSALIGLGIAILIVIIEGIVQWLDYLTPSGVTAMNPSRRSRV
ncbi:MAG: hypothetical protein R3C53_15590 [Pirellulaceae bacterium]